MTQTVSLILSVLTALTQAALAFAVVLFVLDPKRAKALIGKYAFGRNAIRAAFVIALVATAGSLFYSQIAGFVPCELCWFQRIFMYPQVVILGLALWNHDENIIDSSLALAGIGLIVSLYHNFIIYTAVPSAFCSLTSVSCATKTVLGLGYVTIPLMALTAFATLVMILLSGKSQNKND